VNAVERLWRAIAARDWDGASAQFLPNAEVLWPHTGERMSAPEYVAVNRAYPGTWAIELERIVGDGELVAVELRVSDGDETHLCAGFYDLHQARIAGAVEIWVEPGSQTPPADRR
jgi:SnoaL-like domain